MRSHSGLLLCKWMLLSLQLLRRANEAIYHLEREKCDNVKAFFFLNGFSQGQKLINHLGLWEERPVLTVIFSHVLERPISPTDHVEAKGILTASSSPLPAFPPPFTLCSPVVLETALPPRPPIVVLRIETKWHTIPQRSHKE